MVDLTPEPSEDQERSGENAARADMRVEVVKRELNQGALAGFDSSVTDYAAKLVIAALDSFDEEALKAEFRRGFETGEVNAALLREEERSAAYRAGYAEAVARLRDDQRYNNWWMSSDAKPDGPIRRHLADYLEIVGPDGLDVTTSQIEDVRSALRQMTSERDRWQAEADSLTDQLGDMRATVSAAEADRDVAYRAGREDAAKAIENADTSGWPGGRGSDVDGCQERAAALARGQHTQDGAR